MLEGPLWAACDAKGKGKGTARQKQGKGKADQSKAKPGHAKSIQAKQKQKQHFKPTAGYQARGGKHNMKKNKTKMPTGENEGRRKIE